MILVVMGVTGSGKSTVARGLALRLGWEFLEADDFHSAANKEKMHAGVPLTDEDRGPWLGAMHEELKRLAAEGKSAVLACSALKEAYRERLEEGLGTKFVYLRGDYETIAGRLRARAGHFAGESILADQFAVLEEPRGAVEVSVGESPEKIVERVVERLGLGGEAVEERALLGKVRWRLLPFLLLLYVVAYLDRINVGFAALQMKGQLGFSDAVYGLGAGIFFVGYFLFQVPSNLMLERIGARRWIGVLMAAWGAISASMMFVHSAQSFYTMRFLLGVAEAGFFPGVIFYLRGWFPAAARAGVVAIFMTAGPISGMLGGPISGALLDWDRLAGLAGWQWMFLMEGIPAILLGAVTARVLPNGPGEAKWLGKRESAWLAWRVSEERPEARVATVEDGGRWWASATLWGFALVYFGLNTCTYGISLWLPSALKSLSGLPNLLLGFLSAVPYVVAATTMVLVGTHSDRTGERRWHIALSAVAGGAALVTAGSTSAVVASVAAYAIALSASSSMAGPFWALASGSLTGATAARGIALINAVGNLGSGVGPYWIGYMRDVTGGFRAGLYGVALLILTAGTVVLFLGRAKREGT